MACVDAIPTKILFQVASGSPNVSLFMRLPLRSHGCCLIPEAPIAFPSCRELRLSPLTWQLHFTSSSLAPPYMVSSYRFYTSLQIFLDHEDG